VIGHNFDVEFIKKVYHAKQRTKGFLME